MTQELVAAAQRAWGSRALARGWPYMIGALLVGLYSILNPLRLEHFAMLAGGISLWMASPRTREFILVFLPLLLFAWIYDLLRLFNARAHEIVTIGEVRELELALFGASANEARHGPVEVLMDYQHALLDVIGSAWYASHVATIIGFGVILWWQSRSRPVERPAARPVERPAWRRLDQFLWGFLLLNLIGFSIQVLFPVAPPWYVELYGYAPPEALISGDPAGLARVDALMGIDYFSGVYSQASYVFGAVPSLHAAYPVWIALHLRRGWWSFVAWFYAAGMSFFAVYFVHHYVVDLIAGAGLSVLVYVLFQRTALGAVPVRVGSWLRDRFLVPHEPDSPEEPSS